MEWVFCALKLNLKYPLACLRRLLQFLRPLLSLRGLEEALPLDGIADLSHDTEQGLDTQILRPKLNDKLHRRHETFPLNRNVFMLRFLLFLQYLSTHPSCYLSHLHFNQSITLADGSSTSSLTFPTACIPWSMATADPHSGYEVMRHLYRTARKIILIHSPFNNRWMYHLSTDSVDTSSIDTKGVEW